MRRGERIMFRAAFGGSPSRLEARIQPYESGSQTISSVSHPGWFQHAMVDDGEETLQVSMCLGSAQTGRGTGRAWAWAWAWA